MGRPANHQAGAGLRPGRPHFSRSFRRQGVLPPSTRASHVGQVQGPTLSVGTVRDESRSIPTTSCRCSRPAERAFVPAVPLRRRRSSAPPRPLSEGGNVAGCDGGFPFPIPKNGNEAIWNTELPSRATVALSGTRPRSAHGDYTMVKLRRVRLLVRKLLRGPRRRRGPPE